MAKLMNVPGFLLSLLLSTPTPAEPEAQVLTAENLRLAAMQMDESFDLRAYALSRVAREDPERWLAIRDEETEREALLEERMARLEQAMAQVDPSAPFLLAGPVRLMSYDIGAEAFPVTPLLRSEATVFRNPAPGNGLPGRFTLLTSNSELGRRWPLDREAAAEFIASREGKDLATRFGVYQELELVLTAYAAGGYFQAAIQSASLFEDESQETLIVRLDEERDLEKMQESFPLADGVTLDLRPINSFYVFGHRLLSTLSPSALRQADCQDEEPLDDHRVIRCRQAMSYGGQEMEKELLFVGGRLAGLAVTVLSLPPQIRADQLRILMERDLGLGGESPVDIPHCWTHRAAAFRLDEYRLRSGDASAPFLQVRAEALPALLPAIDCRP